MVKNICFFVAIYIATWLFSSIVYANDSYDISLPTNKSRVYIVKKPSVVFDAKSVDYKSIKIVMLDDTDITSIVTIKNNRFYFTLPIPLASGEHTLSVIYGAQGDKQKDAKFITKQTKSFNEFTTKFSATTTYKNAVTKSDSLDDIPHYSVESNPAVDIKASNPYWSSSFNMSTRYLEKSNTIEPPQKRGLDLAGYIFKAQYNKNELNMYIDIGDIQVDESDYSTQGLANRGGKFGIGYGSYTMETFLMDTQQRYGFKDGMGLDAGNTNSIYGASLEKTFFKDTKLKVVYLKGSKNGNGFGSASMDYNGSSVKKGRVLALTASSPVFQDRLNISSEIDFSHYDDNIFDGYGYQNDKAYNIKLEGNLSGHYQYGLKYEYIGTNYYSIGNEGLENDKKGLMMTAAANYDHHSINIAASRYRDNLKNHKDAPIVYTSEGEIDYSCSRFEYFPINISARRDIAKSKNEPSADSKQNLVTDTYHGDISYSKEAINTMFGIDYSFANDKTKTDSDQKTTTYTFAPSYNADNFNISSNLSFNRSVDIKSDVATRTWTAGLSLGGNFFENSLNYNCASTYTKTKSSDGEQNSRSLGVTFQLAYTWSVPKKFVILKNPSVGIQGGYNHNRDKIQGENNDDFNLILFVEVPLEYVF